MSIRTVNSLKTVARNAASLIEGALSPQEQARVQVLTTDDIPAIFVTEAPRDTTTVIKGYRVKVNYEPNATRQRLLQSIFNAAKKR